MKTSQASSMGLFTSTLTLYFAISFLHSLLIDNRAVHVETGYHFARPLRESFESVVRQLDANGPARRE